MIDGTPVDPKVTHVVDPGGVIQLTMPGGGGSGDPRGRPPERIRADVRAGYVTSEVGRRAHGRAE
jgi:N-methylhydantoinase B